MLKQVSQQLSATGFEEHGFTINQLIQMSEDLVPFSDGVRDATAAIQTRLDQAGAAGGGEVVLPAGIFKITATLLINASKVVLTGSGPSTIIKPTGSTTFPAIKFFGGTAPGTAVNFNSTGAFGAITIVLVGGGGASFAAGDYIQISDVNGNCEVTRIVSIATDTLTLSNPLYDDFTTANTAKVQKLAMLSHVGLQDLAIDGNLNSGADARGVWAYCVRDSIFENLKVTGTTGAGIYVELGHNNKILAPDLEDCGSANESDLEVRRQTAYQVDDVQSLRASGFGPQIAFSNGGQTGKIISTLANGRGIKLQMVQCSQFGSLQSFRSLATYTGISVTVGSKRNQFANLLAVANGAAGIWCDALSSKNVFVNCASLNNTTRDVEINSSADDNVFINLLCAPTAILDGGLRTVFQNMTGALTGPGYFKIDNGAGAGPVFTLDRHSASPAIGDILGEIHFDGRDSAGNVEHYGRVTVVINDPVSTSEDGRLDLVLVEAGVEQFYGQFTQPNNGDTALLVRCNDSGVFTLKRVKEGIADSGGAGLRQLVVDN